MLVVRMPDLSEQIFYVGIKDDNYYRLFHRRREDNPNGAKVANITGGDGNALEYLAEEFLSILFEPSTFIIYFVEKRSSHQYH